MHTLGKYASIQFQNVNIIPECTKAVCQAIVDKHLPVRVQAAVTINCLLNYKQTTDMLRPELPTILEKYIEIMQTLDNEGVVLALEGLVQKYAQEIQPFAV